MESTAGAGRRTAALYASAAEAALESGRRISSAVVDAGGQVAKFFENRNISQLGAESASVMSDLDREWNETVKKADPNDPTVAAKFREERLEPVLQKLSESGWTEGGQRFAEAQVRSLRNHFFEKTASDMTRMAGMAARQNIETLTNKLSNAAITDPTSLRTSLSMVEQSVGAMVDSSPNISGVAAAAAKSELTLNAQKEIVKAAAIGAININPEEGFKKFSGPEFSKYISGAELKQLEQQANSVIRAQRVDESYRRTLEKRAKQDASDARENEYFAKLHSGDPKEMAQVSAKAIATDPVLTTAARQRMVGIVERETKPEASAKVSNRTASELISRLRAPVGDPRRIDSLDPVYDAMLKGDLNKSDFKFVADEFKNMRTPEGSLLGREQEEFIKSVKPLIDKSNPLSGKIDHTGPQGVYEFTMALRRKIDEYRKAGKDPRDLMDPSKPDYMGSPAAVAPYQKSLQESIQGAAAALRRGSATAPSVTNPPASLRGIASLSYSATRKQFRDDATGKVYNLDGTEVK